MLPNGLDRPPERIIGTALSNANLLSTVDTITATRRSKELLNENNKVPFSELSQAKSSLPTHHGSSQDAQVYSTFVDNGSPRIGSGLLATALRDIANANSGAPNGILPTGKAFMEHTPFVGAVWREHSPPPFFTTHTGEYLHASNRPLQDKHQFSPSPPTGTVLSREHPSRIDITAERRDLSPSTTPRKLSKRQADYMSGAGSSDNQDSILSQSAADLKGQNTIKPMRRLESRRGRSPMNETTSKGRKHPPSRSSERVRTVYSPQIPSVTKSRRSSLANQENPYPVLGHLSLAHEGSARKRDFPSQNEADVESKRTRGLLTGRRHLDGIPAEHRTPLQTQRLSSLKVDNASGRRGSSSRSGLQSSSRRRVPTQREDETLSQRYHLSSLEVGSTIGRHTSPSRATQQTNLEQRPRMHRGDDGIDLHSFISGRRLSADRSHHQQMSTFKTSDARREPSISPDSALAHTGSSKAHERQLRHVNSEYPPSNRSSLRSRHGRPNMTVVAADLDEGHPSYPAGEPHVASSFPVHKLAGTEKEDHSVISSHLKSRKGRPHLSSDEGKRTHKILEHELQKSDENEAFTRNLPVQSTSEEVQLQAIHSSLQSQGSRPSTSQQFATLNGKQFMVHDSRPYRRPSICEPMQPSSQFREGLPSTQHRRKSEHDALHDGEASLPSGQTSRATKEGRQKISQKEEAEDVRHHLESRQHVETSCRGTSHMLNREIPETVTHPFHSQTTDGVDREHFSPRSITAPKEGISLSENSHLRIEKITLTGSANDSVQEHPMSDRTVDSVPKDRSTSINDASPSTIPQPVITESGNVMRQSRTGALISRNVDSMEDESDVRRGILGRLLHEMRARNDSLNNKKGEDNQKRYSTVADVKEYSEGETHMKINDHKNDIKITVPESSKAWHHPGTLVNAALEDSIKQRSATILTKGNFVKENVEEERRTGMIGKLLSSTVASGSTLSAADMSPTKQTSDAGNGTREDQIKGRLEDNLRGVPRTATADEMREGMLGRLLEEERWHRIQADERPGDEDNRSVLSGKEQGEQLESITPNIARHHPIDNQSVKIVKESPDTTPLLTESPRSGILGKMLEHEKVKSGSPSPSQLLEGEIESETSLTVSPRSGILGTMLAGGGDAPPNRLGMQNSRSRRGTIIAEAEDIIPEYTKHRDLFVSRSFPSRDSESPDESRRDSKVSIDERILAYDPSAKLLYSAKKGDWSVVEQSLSTDQRFDLSLADSHGFNVVLLAVKDSKVDIFNKLLAYGADLYASTNDRRSVAHIAAMYGNEEMMSCILDKKVDLTRSAGPHGQLPLHYACCRTSSRGYRLACLLLKQRDQRLSEDRDRCLPIQYAILCNNVPLIKTLLEKNAEQQIKHVDANGDTLLHLACRKGEDNVVQLIVDLGGVNVNATNAMGWTPLHEVAYNGDENALRIMYRLHADANILDKDDKTPLHVAAERGHTRVVETLIDKFNGSIRARTRDGSTLLHIAALSGHADTALAFLKRGVPLYMPNKRGALGLHSAAAAGFTDVVRMLITRGTNVDIRTRDNYTALHVAVQSGRASVVETLLGFGADVHVQGGHLGETALHIAASLTTEDATECAVMLLKSGAQPNVTRSDGETPLHIAARNPLPSMIRLLLSEGADPKLTSHTGESALHVAARSCNSEAARLMLEHLLKTLSTTEIKEFVNARTFEDGLTAVHYAAEITHDQVHSPGEDGKLINTLIDYGGQPEIQTISTLETAMHFAARSGNETVLLAMVAKIGAGAVQIVQNKQSKNGWSPLLEACARGHSGVARILLKHHARIDVFDESGRTALHLAAANGHLQLTHLLLQHKAFVNSKSKAGEAPLHLAAQNGHVKVVNLLVQDHGAALEAITLDNQTALHFAAKHGQLAVSQTLLALGANPNARDDKGQTPLHLAAENDFPDVVKLFLKMKQNNRGVLTAVDLNGFTCAHIAAMKGSLAVVKELMMIDKAMVIQAKTKTMEATTLHMAAAGGHEKIVKILLENGANAEDENAHGMTALHLGAKNGFIPILEVFDKSLWRKCSRKTGLNALHIAAYYGNTEFVIEMLKHVPASSRSEPPIYNHHVVKEFATEYGFTPLHLAAQSGHDSLVRMLLNQGVQVDATSTTMSVIPLHLAAQQGHIAVVGMLLSRSTQQQHAKDWRGRTPLHLAAMNGHYEMVSLLIAQGSNINVMDQNGWTGMHYATKAGHINVVKLFVKSSADAQAETKEGKVPLCFAAAHNHIDCLRFLLKQKHDTHALMEDRKFIFDLMVCGKGTDNEPLKEFILQSPAPIDTAVKLSSLYRDMSEKEKERAKDLSNVSVFAEEMAVELLSITASEYNAALLLKAKDNRGRPLLDVLIENEQKEVVSYASVQRYLTEIWTGRVDWSFGKTVAFALVVFLCPPAWFYFSLPLDSRIGRAPIIKFVCHIVSHVYFTMLLTVVVLNLTHKIYEVTNVIPNPVEWVLLLWLSGNLVSELSNVGGGSGLGIVKVLILVLSAAAIAVHIMAFALPALFMQHLDNDERLHFARTMLYLKNQLFAFALLFAFVEFLDFLTVHHLFGPWAIIIRDLMYDLTRFLVILLLFIAGFTLHVTSIFQPAYQPVDDDSADLMRLASPEQTLEMLFFSLFGLVEPDTMPPLHLVPDFAKIILKLLFGIYLLVTLIVLINLLIAMMSDTYQRIQAQSDKEWKFGRAILIRQMNKRSATPAPINMLTKLIAVLRVAYRNKLRVCTQKAQQDLRYEEDIDAFSMNGDGGRTSPGLRQTDDDNEIRESEELGKSANWNIETVIDWKRIVEMYYQANGEVDTEDVHVEVPS